MKLIKAYIRPHLLEDVYSALNHEGYCCMTVFKGEGTGRYADPEEKHGSLDFPAMHSKVVKIEIAAPDKDVSPIVKIIKNRAHTGTRGDGMIFISPVERTLRIRDDSEGEQVLF